MNNPIIKVIRQVFVILMIILIVFSGLMFWLGVFDLREFLMGVITIILYLTGVYILIRVLFHAVFEKALMERNREKSKEVLTEKMGKSRQVSGDPRAGKDSSVVASSKLIAEVEFDRDMEELERLENILYLYDFERLNEFLDKRGKRFLISGKDKLLRRFLSILRENDAFIHKEFRTRKKKPVVPGQHILDYMKYKGNRVPDFAFDDGITPGGIPFLDLLFNYVILYTYRYTVTNYILSNQPIMESFKIEKDGSIMRNFSKVFSQKYIRIKEDNPMPLPIRGVIVETEMAVWMANVDKENENDVRVTSGIREFFTTIYHLLDERVYYYLITQDPYRVTKTVRELFQTYLHVFKQVHACTSPVRRSLHDGIIRSLHFRKKLARLKLYLSKPNGKPWKRATAKLHRIRKKISKHESKKKQLYNRGYIKTYIGVYKNINDVTKKVQFSRFGVYKENQNQIIQFPAFGFVLHTRMVDSWGAYNTHFMNFIREKKHRKHSMHFNDIPNWMSFEVVDADIKQLEYSAGEDLTAEPYEDMSDKDKRKEQVKLLTELQNKEPERFKHLLRETGVIGPLIELKKQKRKKVKLQTPLLENLKASEIENLYKDITGNTFNDSIKLEISKEFYRLLHDNETHRCYIDLHDQEEYRNFLNLTWTEIEHLCIDLISKHSIEDTEQNEYLVYQEWKVDFENRLLEEYKIWR